MTIAARRPERSWTKSGLTRGSEHRAVRNPLRGEPLDIRNVQSEAVTLLAHRGTGVSEIGIRVDQYLQSGQRRAWFIARTQARAAMVPPALSPAIATAVGVISNSEGRDAIHRSAATASLTAAGLGCSGDRR
jgi:hypothetical protein